MPVASEVVVRLVGQTKKFEASMKRSSKAAVMRSPLKIWVHSLKGRLLVTRMLLRS